MKRLTLVRHGNAEPKGSRVSDFERPLDRRGQSQAEAMARRLLGSQLVPDMLIASPALRTRQTAEVIAREMGIPVRRIHHDERLYLARADDILSVVQAIGPRVEHLMVVGHNPGISDLARWLAVRGDFLGELATGAACTLTFNATQWSAIRPGSAAEARCESPPSRLFARWV